MQYGRPTLTQFIIQQQRQIQGASGDVPGLLGDIATACKVISNAVGKGTLATGPGGPPVGAAPGDGAQRMLDVISNDVMLRSNLWAGHLTGLASSRMDGVCPIPRQYPRGRSLLLFAPLDGSGNSDVNVAVGTIFSVLQAPRPGQHASPADFLQPGTRQVCAGFALYGPSTVLVITTGNGVDGFTLDRDVGEFILTQPQMRIGADSGELAVDAFCARRWEPPVKRFVDDCLGGRNGPRGRDYSLRWMASLVAETYRILTRGGVFMCPRDAGDAGMSGRLRLLFEASPIAFIVEQAGGLATTGRERTLELQPTDLHQCAPLIFGSRNEVECIVRYHREYVSGIEPERFDLPLFGTRSLFRHP